jgi:hypothetical protein
VLNIHVGCVPATDISPIEGDRSSWTYTASLSPSCSFSSHTTTVGTYTAWTGIAAAVSAECVPLINSTAPSTTGIDSTQYPIALGFTVNASAASAVFCYAYQRVFNATATLDLQSGRVIPQLENATLLPGHSLEQYMPNGRVTRLIDVCIAANIGYLAMMIALTTVQQTPGQAITSVRWSDQFLATPWST